jgi:hypothetical protein
LAGKSHRRGTGSASRGCAGGNLPYLSGSLE